jgi:hypothetical protein
VGVFDGYWEACTVLTTLAYLLYRTLPFAASCCAVHSTAHPFSWAHK